MVPRSLRRLAGPVRRRLKTAARRHARVRAVMTVAQRELTTALADDMYDGQYFAVDREVGGHSVASGYDSYDRITSNANIAAFVGWSTFPATRILDVGCARGFLVEALRELELDAEGVDISQFAVDHPTPGAAGHVRWANAGVRLPFADATFDLCTVIETLEHTEPDDVPRALRELARVTRGWVFATIPSFGTNRNGPGGWYQGKVKTERIPYYESLGEEYGGPVPFDDLFRDAKGEPIEGHLTVASYAWWTEQFAKAGLVRCDETERRLQWVIAHFGLTKYWNFYVFRHAAVPEPPADLRPIEARRAVLARFDLADRATSTTDIELVEQALPSATVPAELV